MGNFFKKLFRPSKKDQFNCFSSESYSQEGEDMILKPFFNDIEIRKGFYVDVGALHPFRFSNTACFYKLGWSGINIEPTPSAIDLFTEYRKRDINLNLGVAEESTEMTFYCFDEPALNSFSKDLSEQRASTTNYKIIDKKKIQVKPLRVILDEFIPKGQKIDFLNIDVEGLDLQVLRSNDWEKYRPDFVLCEDILDFESLPASQVYKFLMEREYLLVAKTLRTLIFKTK